jgi:DNA polymerase I-like protein with 3'-5' exonuclease and polymerase domains
LLIIGDFKALEWNCAVYLSQDPVGIAEFNDPDIDMHTDNKEKFGLPSRHIAKIFLFRLIYGGTAPAYVYDVEFNAVSSSKKFWQDAIDAFYLKYQGVRAWHERLVLEVMETGKVTIPTGRSFSYVPYLDRNGTLTWPRTTILNYPVQGLGAELMVIARVLMKAELKRQNLLSRMDCTVHDSIRLDGPEEEVVPVGRVFYKVWKNIPRAFEKLFGVPYNIPCRVEVKYGINWEKMVKLDDKEIINANQGS